MVSLDGKTSSSVFGKVELEVKAFLSLSFLSDLWKPLCVLFFQSSLPVDTQGHVCSQAIQKDLEECEYHITALETLVSSSQSNRTQFEMIHADWKQLCKAVQVRIQTGKMSINFIYIYKFFYFFIFC